MLTSGVTSPSPCTGATPGGRAARKGEAVGAWAREMVPSSANASTWRVGAPAGGAAPAGVGSAGVPQAGAEPRSAAARAAVISAVVVLAAVRCTGAVLPGEWAVACLLPLSRT